MRNWCFTAPLAKLVLRLAAGENVPCSAGRTPVSACFLDIASKGAGKNTLGIRAGRGNAGGGIDSRCTAYRSLDSAGSAALDHCWWGLR